MSHPPLRILAFGNCPLDPTLGSGKTRLAWADGLRARGHAVETHDAPALMVRGASRFGVRLGLALSARRRIARTDLARYDLVEFFGVEFWWATRWLQRRKRRPLIVAHTDGLEFLAYHRLHHAGQMKIGRLERWMPFWDLQRTSEQAFACADRFVAGCRLDVEHALTRRWFTPDHAQVISPGLDRDFLSRLFVVNRENTVVFFGSWTERKGIAHLPLVMNAFLTEFSTWRLLVIGASQHEAAIRAAFTPAMQSRIEVAPKLSVAQIVGHLERAKILFSPSEYEGFGLATAEAMACGCAAVVTPTGFGGDLRQGVDAWVCPFCDRPAMLAALSELARHDARRETLARAGQVRVQELSWPASIRRLEENYLRWLEPAGGTSAL